MHLQLICVKNYTKTFLMRNVIYKTVAGYEKKINKRKTVRSSITEVIYLKKKFTYFPGKIKYLPCVISFVKHTILIRYAHYGFHLHKNKCIYLKAGV